MLMSGIPMNRLFNGRPQWNNWGGLNDVTRNQQYSHGLKPTDYNFGGLLGTVNIEMRPSKQRSGFRLSSSISNRTYAGRIMATYNSGTSKKGLTYAISASRRWAGEGFIEGTLYDAYSVYGALEYDLDDQNTLSLSAFIAPNRRGGSAPITEETYLLAGRKYNPYWGWQNGERRNSRERNIQEPIFMLHHFFENDRFRLTSGIAYRHGSHARSRLSYFNAPNPDPTYYRYLPSFYINSPIGANFISAQQAKAGFSSNPQLSWQKLYLANTNNLESDGAAYVLQDDVVKDSRLTINSSANLNISDEFKVDFGIYYKKLRSANYAKIKDLLGAEFHLDKDPFSDTANDLDGPVEKKEGASFSYNYLLSAQELKSFLQIKYKFARCEAHLSGFYSFINYQRDGQFRNERFSDSSKGKSPEISFTNYGIKAGVSYQITGKHLVSANGLFQFRAPRLQQIFINPREQNANVANIKNERLSTADLNYHIRMPNLSARISGFYTRFQNTTDINFFLC